MLICFFPLYLLLGTGKTRTLVETVAETLYQETRKTAKNPRILVCAPSSSAINEVACRLAIKFPQNIERSSTVKPVNSKWIYCVLYFFV